MSKTTIVIGTGMAGLAAARELQDAGYTVKILEARDRIGGRTHTDFSLGPSIDLGGSWIHGPIANPMTALAKKFGVRWGYTDFINQAGDKVLAFDAQGQRFDIAAYTEGMQLAAGAATHAWGSILYNLPSTGHDSLADLYAYGLPGLDNLSPTQQKGYYYSAVIRTQYGDAADLTEIDWRLSEDYITLPGGDFLLHGGGYEGIVRGLADRLRIETDTVVEEIEYDQTGVCLQTSQGREICDQVIVTVPLGVLQAGAIKFSPSLPKAKEAAMTRMGFGNYEKLALKFPRQFWPQEPERFHYLTDQEPELFTSWLNTAHYTEVPILVAYHSGSRAKHINHLSDEALIEEALAALQIMFGPPIPTPTAYLRTQWQEDPFSRGSYSFRKVGQKASDHLILAEPIAQRIFFAGEATHPHYYATVHGAYETGIRAARDVMGALEK